MSLFIAVQLLVRFVRRIIVLCERYFSLSQPSDFQMRQQIKTNEIKTNELENISSAESFIVWILMNVSCLCILFVLHHMLHSHVLGIINLHFYFCFIFESLTYNNFLGTAFAMQHVGYRTIYGMKNSIVWHHDFSTKKHWISIWDTLLFAIEPL